MSVLDEFVPKKEFVVCIDSDGCVMDTMDIKHIKCFGPCMVAEWGLDEYRKELLDRWNEINLYSKTRGINRFKGLALALAEVNASLTPIDGIEALSEWVRDAPELSNAAVERMIPQNHIFEKALSWSKAVNEEINRLSEEEKRPFENAYDTIKMLKQRADIVIVSSANAQAVNEEWNRYGFMPYVDCVCAQDVGTKAFCISELVKKGYEPDKILMCGDAPGDLEAAERNGVLYYPILVRKEKDSWLRLAEEAAEHFFRGEYAGEYADAWKEEFWKNLMPGKAD